MNKVLKGIAVLSVASLALTACGGSNDAASSNSSNNDTFKVVTTTDVYADIVKEVAGDTVEVSPIIASTSQDPHSYEATTQDRLTVKDANMVVLNGGGYDQFLEDMAGVDNKDQKVVNAVKASGLVTDEEYEELAHGHSHEEGEEHDHDHGSFNEHVWYDLDTMQKLSTDIANTLAEAKPENAEQYKKAAEDYNAKLAKVLDDAKSIKADGKKYVATEPVPGYLLEDAGYTDATPSDLVSAVEDESDIAPLTMQEVKEMLTDKEANLLAFNEQTETNQTKEIFQAAQDADVPRASFTETLPEGKNYVDWMTENVSNLKKAVA